MATIHNSRGCGVFEICGLSTEPAMYYDQEKRTYVRPTIDKEKAFLMDIVAAFRPSAWSGGYGTKPYPICKYPKDVTLLVPPIIFYGGTDAKGSFHKHGVMLKEVVEKYKLGTVIEPLTSTHHPYHNHMARVWFWAPDAKAIQSFYDQFSKEEEEAKKK